MISEVCNAIFLTYIASEYLISEQNNNGSRSSSSFSSISPIQKRRIRAILFILLPIVLVINVMDRITGTIDTINSIFDTFGLLHIPFRIIFVATFYILALYIDVTIVVKNELKRGTVSGGGLTTTSSAAFGGEGRILGSSITSKKSDNDTSSSSSNNSTFFVIPIKPFLKHVLKAFCYVLPAYPFMAVIISFIFMFVINIFERLHLNLDMLNAPIYYGTLYGPFAWIYIHVKQQIIQEQYHYTLPV